MNYLSQDCFTWVDENHNHLYTYAKNPETQRIARSEEYVQGQQMQIDTWDRGHEPQSKLIQEQSQLFKLPTNRINRYAVGFEKLPNPALKSMALQSNTSLLLQQDVYSDGTRKNNTRGANRINKANNLQQAEKAIKQLKGVRDLHNARGEFEEAQNVSNQIDVMEDRLGLDVDVRMLTELRNINENFAAQRRRPIDRAIIDPEVVAEEERIEMKMALDGLSEFNREMDRRENTEDRRISRAYARISPENVAPDEKLDALKDDILRESSYGRVLFLPEDRNIIRAQEEILEMDIPPEEYIFEEMPSSLDTVGDLCEVLAMEEKTQEEEEKFVVEFSEQMIQRIPANRPELKQEIRDTVALRGVETQLEDINSSAHGLESKNIKKLIMREIIMEMMKKPVRNLFDRNEIIPNAEVIRASDSEQLGQLMIESRERVMERERTRRRMQQQEGEKMTLGERKLEEEKRREEMGTVSTDLQTTTTVQLLDEFYNTQNPLIGFDEGNPDKLINYVGNEDAYTDFLNEATRLVNDMDFMRGFTADNAKVLDRRLNRMKSPMGKGSRSTLVQRGKLKVLMQFIRKQGGAEHLSQEEISAIIDAENVGKAKEAAKR